ncbi:hypothetical protein M0R45_025889 [Rubus argutus]|uniref:Uncharacterized protein n=1 Tax=Rubus argutus TaxID=59490 RepID=A0AAW1WY86_RUBAR
MAPPPSTATQGHSPLLPSPTPSLPHPLPRPKAHSCTVICCPCSRVVVLHLGITGRCRHCPFHLCSQLRHRLPVHYSVLPLLLAPCPAVVFNLPANRLEHLSRLQSCRR